MHRVLVLAGLFVVSFVAACSGSRAVAGAERGDCRPDRTCEAGLWCLSSLCVRPPAADCRGVGEALASLDLGNYAPVEDRAPVVARHAAACERALLTKEEGACIEKADDRWAAGMCAPRLADKPADAAACARVERRLATDAVSLRAANPDPQLGAWLETAAKAMTTSCHEDRWPAELVACAVGDSRDADVTLAACHAAGPRSLHRRIQSRLETARREQMQ